MCENKAKTILSQLDEDLKKLWFGSEKQDVPKEWEMDDMENFDLCIQLYAHVMIDLLYDLRLKLKSIKDHLFPVNLDICSDPEDQTKITILKWYVLMRYTRRKKKVSCKGCSRPCLKNVFLVIETMEKDLFQWEKSVFKFSEERPDEDYRRAVQKQHKKWNNKYSPLDELQSVISQVTSSRSPTARRSSRRRDVNPLNKYHNSSFTLLFNEKLPEASSLVTSTLKPNNESSLETKDYYIPSPNKIRRIKTKEMISSSESELPTHTSSPCTFELASSCESNTSSVIFIKPKKINFSIEKILKHPYDPSDSTSTAVNKEEVPHESAIPKEEKCQEMSYVFENLSQEVGIQESISNLKNPSIEVSNQKSANTSENVANQESITEHPSEIVENQDDTSEYVIPSEKVVKHHLSKKVKDLSKQVINNSATPSNEVIEQQSTSESAKTENIQNDPSKSALPCKVATVQDYSNPVAGSSNSKDYGPKPSVSSSSLGPYRKIADYKKGIDFQSKAYAFINENGPQKMTHETYKYILFFRMKTLSNKLLNYIQYQSDLFDIFAEVQS